MHRVKILWIDGCKMTMMLTMDIHRMSNKNKKPSEKDECD